MAVTKTAIAVLFLVLLLPTGTDLVKIHRASPRNFKPKTPESGWLSFCRFLPDISKLVVNKEAWVFTIPATILVGLCGVLPVLLIPVESGHALREGVTADHLRLLLSFAVGGLLGDVFLHLLPEAWSSGDKGDDSHSVNFFVGMWVIVGLFLFFILEKAFGEDDDDEKSTKQKEKVEVIQNGAAKNSKIIQNGHSHAHMNGTSHHQQNDVRKRHTENAKSSPDPIKSEIDGEHSEDEKEHKIKVVGYLNLFANIIDNFTHGLAIAGSFLVSRKVGMCTTCAILLHEIPHEVGDFAILLRSGFNKKDAAIAQISTASGGIFGAVVGLIAEHAGDTTAWILPLSSGGFIYIAMVTIIPELLQEKRPMESVKQVIMMILGVASMALVSFLH